MANTRTKKAEVDASVEKETVAKVAPKKTPRKFAMDDPILCKSVTFGELLLPGKKSQLLYTWANYGDTTEVEFQDLQALRSTRSAYLNAPYFVIEDEDLLEQWPEFKALYEKVAAIDVDNLFNLPINQFKKRLREIPVGFKDSIKNIASDKILNGSLDSLTKINALDEILGTDLKLLIQ
jgi:hypothetical protein|nr:MAG TPA: hypothetical protein [Caudoviricetes sp.]